MHDLTGTIVAIFEDHEAARKAEADLAGEGFSSEVLHGEEGRGHLAGEEEGGLVGLVKKLGQAFGDMTRVTDRLDRALEAGATVLSVEADEEQADQIVGILEKHGGHDMWRLGEWSFNRVGPEGEGEG